MNAEAHKVIVVFYHNADNDGLLSGVIAEHYIDRRGHTPIMIGANYGDDFEKLFIERTANSKMIDEIYFLDVSDKKFMEKYADRIIYIDHHAKAMAEAPKVKDRHCVDGVAACRLTFDYFTQMPNHVFHDKEYFVNRSNDLEPLFVAIIGEYDIWDKNSPLGEKLNFGQEVKYNSVKVTFLETKKILVGDKSLDAIKLDDFKNISKDEENWGYLHYLVQKGEGVLDFVKSTKNKVKPQPVSVCGFSGVAINTHIKSSLIYDLSNDEEFLMVFNIEGGIVNVSFYTNKPHVNCAEIASSFGGGGHKGAAGCRMTLGQLIDLNVIKH